MTVQEGIQAGKVSKTYGLQGEVHLILKPSMAEHISEGIPLFIDLGGQRVPFFTEEVELVSGDHAIVKFEFVNSMEDAKKICGCEVYFDHIQQGKSNPEKDPMERVLGYRVRDAKLGVIGTVKEYIPAEMNPRWIISTGDSEMIISAAKEYVVKTDHPKKVLYLNLPEGITEL